MGLPPVVVVVGVILVIGLILGVIVYRRLRAAAKRPEYLEKYAEHVMACLAPGTSDPAIATIAGRYQHEATRHQITWGELFAVEAYLLARQPEVALRRRAWSLRDKFREVVGTRQYDNYLLSNPPNENDPDADLPLLRADLERLLGALHWSYALIPVRERLRAQIITFVSWQIAVWTILAAGLLLWAAVYGQTLLATLVLVMLGGALGGFVSLLRRIQMVPTGGDPLVNIFELENGRVSLYLAPLSGALFALVLYFIFMGDLVQGSFFPKLGNLDLHLWAFEWGGQPATHVEYAKLLVWAFIAGFAERLVPDTLARLVERGEEASAASRTAPPPGQATGMGAGRGLKTRMSPPVTAGGTTEEALQSPPVLPVPRTRITSPFR